MLSIAGPLSKGVALGLHLGLAAQPAPFLRVDFLHLEHALVRRCREMELCGSGDWGSSGYEGSTGYKGAFGDLTEKEPGGPWVFSLSRASLPGDSGGSGWLGICLKAAAICQGWQ